MKRLSALPNIRPSRRQRLVSAVAAVVLAVAGLVTAALPAQARPLQDHTPATYNMEGSNQGSKWTSNVAQLTRDHDVIALQEAGARPNMSDGRTVAQDQNRSVQLWRWQAGTFDRPVFRNVYYMQTDTNPNAPNGGRVNLAIVTPYEADEVFIIPPAFNGSRPSFGIRIGETIFFTLHGLSGSGNDDRAMLDAMAQTALNAGRRDGRNGGYQWAALGDFNRDPDDLAVPANSHIYRPYTATHQNGSEYDYMVGYVDGGARIPQWNGHVPFGLSADHFPVEFGPIPLRGGAGNPDVTWNLNPKNGSVAASNYDKMINSLRTAAGNHGYQDNVNITSSDRDRVLSERVDYLDDAGNPATITLFFSAHDMRLRGWDNGQRAFQFNDWDLGRALNRQFITLLYPGDDKSLYDIYTTSTASAFQNGDDPHDAQRVMSAEAIRGALTSLASPTEPFMVAHAGLVMSTAVTEAARYGGVSALTMQALGDDNPENGHRLDDTAFALYQDWPEISTFTRNMTTDPNTTHPLVLDDIHQTLRTVGDAAHFVALIQSPGE